MALTKVTEGIRTLGTDEVIATNIATDAVTTGKILDDNVTIAKIAGSASAAADTFLKKDGTWSAVASGIEWQAVQTTGFTAVAGKGYPCNTTASAFTVTLPASASVGDQISLVDYAGTFDTNKLDVDPNGLKLNGSTAIASAVDERQGATLTYVDVTQGWLVTSGVNSGTSSLGSTYSVDFLVVAGGGSGGAGYQSGGGGAGGYRASFNSETSGGGGISEASLTFQRGTVYTVTVGAGAAAETSDGTGNDGNLSLISGSNITTISSVAGGGGGSYHDSTTGRAGGSGGGAGRISGSLAGGAGTANQGYDGGATGGTYSAPYRGGGGGGASAVGGESMSNYAGGAGGNGEVSTITAASVTRGGGGGGGSDGTGGGNGAAGSGGGTSGSSAANSGNATVNTGGGSGGTGHTGYNSGSGGSGVVILRMPTSNYSTTTTGSPTVTTSGVDTILTFNGDGTYTG